MHHHTDHPPAAAPAHAIPHMLFAASHPHLKFGRKKRDPNRRMPHMRDIISATGFQVPAEPVSFDYSKSFPADSNVLANDRRGCCTASAKGHRLQLMQVLLGSTAIDTTVLTNLVLQFYSETTGFDPSQDQPDGSNPTDNGGDMQSIAQFLLSTGFPMPDGSRDKFVAAFEIDSRDVAALAYCGNLCLGVDFGIDVTDTVMPADGSAPPAVWDAKAGEKVLGGHDVFAVARLPNGNWMFDSWGLPLFQWTPAFLAKNVVEAFVYISADALKDGKTVLGLDLAGWQAKMAGHAATVTAAVAAAAKA